MDPTPHDQSQRPANTPQDALLNLAEAIGPVSHELQNIFNGIVLQSAIVARKAPAELREAIVAFRELALQGSNLLTWLDRYRNQIRPPTEAVNISEIIRETVGQLQAEGIKVADNTQSADLKLLGHEPDIRRLVSLFLRRAAQTGSPVVEARREGQSVYFQVLEADSGRNVDPEHFFDLHPLTEDRYDYAVCKAIARRVGAGIEVVKQNDGVMIRLEFKSVKDAD
jgi:hypothetical protein